MFSVLLLCFMCAYNQFDFRWTCVPVPYSMLLYALPLPVASSLACTGRHDDACTGRACLLYSHNGCTVRDCFLRRAARVLWFNGNSLESEAEFAMVGALLGLAIYNGRLGGSNKDLQFGDMQQVE